MVDYKKICTVSLLTLFATTQAEFTLFDQGVVVISGPVANTMVTHSDVFEKTDLYGVKMLLKKLIEYEVIRQEVMDTKMPYDESATEKYIANIQKVNNLSLSDLEDLAAQSGRTLYELKQLLTSQYLYDFFLYHKFRTHLVPTDQDVQDYFDNNPDVQPGHCVIQVAFVDFDDNNKNQVSAKIDGILAGKISDESISWSDPIKVNMADIAEEKLFIKNMEEGQVHKLQDKSSFELYKLASKKDEYTVPLTERKASIIETLNRQMYEDLLAKYQEHMLDNVAIIDLTSDKN